MVKKCRNIDVLVASNTVCSSDVMSNISGVAALLLWKGKYVEWEAAHACTLA